MDLWIRKKERKIWKLKIVLFSYTLSYLYLIFSIIIAMGLHNINIILMMLNLIKLFLSFFLLFTSVYSFGFANFSLITSALKVFFYNINANHLPYIILSVGFNLCSCLDSICNLYRIYPSLYLPHYSTSW